MGINREDFEERFGKLLRKARKQRGFVSSGQLSDFTESFELEDDEKKLVADVLEAYHIGIDSAIDPAQFLRGEDENSYRELSECYEGLHHADSDGIQKLIDDTRNGDTKSREELICEYLYLSMVFSVLYSGQGVFLEDLVGEAGEAITAAVNSILGGDVLFSEDMLEDCILDRLDEVVSSAKIQQDEDQAAVRYVEGVADKAAELSGELGRSCTVEELADETGWTADYILEAVRMSGDAIEDINTSGIDLYGREARAKAQALFEEARNRLFPGEADD